MKTEEDIDLENLLDDEIPCEGRHKLTTCAGEVAYLLSSCVRELKVCRTTVDHPIHGTRVRREIHNCKECRRPAKECWTIRPI